MSGYGIFAQAYDGLTDDVQYARMAEYIAKRARREGLAQDVITVDLGCGTGSLSLLLCDRGYDVIAVDASPLMLNILRDKAAGRQGLLLLCQDLTQLDLYGRGVRPGFFSACRPFLRKRRPVHF